jgi:hypothetical protein
MSLTLTILMIIGAWLAVAAAMLWGVLRIARRHPHHRPAKPSEPARDARGPAPVN